MLIGPATHPPLCLWCLRSTAFILAVLCSFASICILLPWGGGLSLYAKMVNLHSYALARTKMENAKRACHQCARCCSGPVHAAHTRACQSVALPLTQALWAVSADFLPQRSEAHISTSCPRCAPVIFLVIGSFYLPLEAGLFK